MYEEMKSPPLYMQDLASSNGNLQAVSVERDEKIKRTRETVD
jgi:hypothetical protein